MANARAGMAAALALLAAAALCCGTAAAALPRLEHPARNDGTLSLLVVGDWGRGGTHNQSLVAEQVRGIFTCFICSWLPAMHLA
jgi:tartrate-resistant acid phosphatase type 5